MSLLTGRIISEVHSQHPDLAPNVIASALAVLCGAFVFVLGILRLGYVFPFKNNLIQVYLSLIFITLLPCHRFIVDFIPLPGKPGHIVITRSKNKPLTDTKNNNSIISRQRSAPS